MTDSNKLISRVRKIQRICWDINKQPDEYKENIANWERIYFTRKVSIWITYFLRNKPVTPTQITILWFFMGISGAILLIFNDYEKSLLGVFLLYVSWILDNVDGELARYKKQFSMEGNLIDMLGHQIIPSMVFCGLTLSLVLQGADLVFIFCGLLATTFVIPLTKMQDNILLLLLIKTRSTSHETETGKKSQNPGDAMKLRENRFIKLVFSLFSTIFTQFAMLYLLIITSILDINKFYVIFYGIGIPLVFIPKYLARSKELKKIENNPSQLRKIIRQEWLDN